MAKLKLRELYKISSGGTPLKSNDAYYNGGDIKWVKTGDLKEKYLIDCEECITEVGLKHSSAKMYEPNTVLVAMYGATIGETSILKIRACTNQACAAFTPTDKVIPEYLYYFFKSKKERFVKDGVGGAQPNISAGYLRNVEMDLISISEQHNIVELFKKIENIINNRRRQLKKLNQLIKSRFTEMFGDMGSKRWPSKPLGSLCKIYRGGSPRPITKFLGGEVPWIKIGDATKGDSIYLKSTKEHIINEGVKNSRLVKNGSLIFANCGVSLGFARIITFDGCIHDGWLSFEDIDASLDKIFLLLSLNQMTDYFREIAPDGTQPNLNTSIMKQYSQIVPPNSLQKQFIEFVQQVNKSKLAIQKSLDKLEILQKSLMQQYFG